DPEHRAEREDRLVLRHLRPPTGELAVADGVLLAARDRALETCRVAVVVVRLHVLAADYARGREDLGLEIECAQRAERVDGPDEEGRAVGRQRLGAGGQRLAWL